VLSESGHQDCLLVIMTEAAVRRKVVREKRLNFKKKAIDFSKF